MTTFLLILGGLLLLSVLVTVHELGHYLVARKLGFCILEFSIGMGPAIFKKKKNGIEYSLRALPIGGMCRFYGEDQEVRDERCFNAQKAWKRLLVIAAGPVMNLLFAILLAIVMLLAYGSYVPRVESVSPGSVAEAAGMRPGDVLTAIEGKRIDVCDLTVSMIRAADGESADITVERDGAPVELTVKNLYDAAEGHNVLGITIRYDRKTFGFFPAIGYSFRYMYGIAKEAVTGTVSFLVGLPTGKANLSDASGPVGIINYASTAISYGFESILQFELLVSVSLAVFNLLPLPALDGGRIVFLLIEMIRRKPINPKIEGAVHFAGLLLLLALIVALCFSDCAALIRGAQGA